MKATLRDKIVEEHAKFPHPHLDRDALKAHLIIHEMVEGQLAQGDPPEVSEVLHRLLAGGLSRHEAIHAIGTIVAREAYKMMKEGRDLDRVSYLRELETLSVESYKKSLGLSES
jgi:hypothetical protein